MIYVVISGLTFMWVLSVQSCYSVALIEASLEELSVRAALGQSCLVTKINALEPSILGGSATSSLWCLAFAWKSSTTSIVAYNRCYLK